MRFNCPDQPADLAAPFLQYLQQIDKDARPRLDLSAEPAINGPVRHAEYATQSRFPLASEHGDASGCEKFSR